MSLSRRPSGLSHPSDQGKQGVGQQRVSQAPKTAGQSGVPLSPLRGGAFMGQRSSTRGDAARETAVALVLEAFPGSRVLFERKAVARPPEARTPAGAGSDRNDAREKPLKPQVSGQSGVREP